MQRNSPYLTFKTQEEVKFVQDELRYDKVNEGIALIQRKNGLTFGTDALLLSAYISGAFSSGLELGSGSGIISILLLKRDKVKSITALEVQKDFADICAQNAKKNGLADRMDTRHCDLREFSEGASYSLAFSNPPFMKTDSGKRNIYDEKNIARHEVMGTIDDFCKCAARSLKFGGSFYAVYRTDRIEDILFSMRGCGIEPKRMTFVHADKDMPPSMVLIEGKRGGACGMRVTPPLLLYKSTDHKEHTDDYDYIYENGCFPKKFK